MLKVLGGDDSEGPLEEMGIHSFIYLCTCSYNVEGDEEDFLICGAR